MYTININLYLILLNDFLFCNNLTFLRFLRFFLPVSALLLVILTPSLSEAKGYSYDHQNLAEVPHDIPKDASYIYLNNNRITRIRAGDFQGFSQCRSLFLHYNPLREIKVGAFSDMVNLGTLNMNYNRLEELRNGVFDGLESLWLLEMYDSPVSQIELGALSPLHELKSIEFSQCENLPEISGPLWEGLSSVERISWLRNGLQRLDAFSFQPLGSVTKLNLAIGKIQVVKTNAFVGMEKLFELDLASNEIHTIETGAFNGLPSIQILELKWNHLKTILPGAFQGMPQLIFLQLSFQWDGNSTLSEVMPQAFYGLSNIRMLDLQSNNLQTLPEDVFDQTLYPNRYPPLIFALHDNPMKCDSRLCWVREMEKIPGFYWGFKDYYGYGDEFSQLFRRNPSCAQTDESFWKLGCED